MRFLPMMLMVAATACTPGAEADADRVSPRDSSLRNSPIVQQPPGSRPMASAADKFCYWNDKKYSDGASVCDAKRRYKCWGDKWVDIGNC